MTIDHSQVRTDIREHERCRRTLSCVVPADIMSAALDETLAGLAGRLGVPGFRKGQAPRSDVERVHHERARRETAERVISDVYQHALAERGLRPVTEGRVASVSHQPGEPLVFEVSFEVEPDIQLARLGGFEVERPSARVQAHEAENALRRLLEENAIWLPPDRGGKPRDGDLVTVQIVPLGDSAGSERVGLPWARRLRLRDQTSHRGRYQLVLGQGDAVPDLETAVRSLSPGESGEFSVRDDGEAKGASGAPVRLRITLEDRRMRELPELDDAFARSLGDFESVEALRDRVRADMEEEAAAGAERVVRERLLDQILLANPFEVPDSMVAKRLESLRDNASDSGSGYMASGEEELRSEAESDVKRALLVERIAQVEGLAATAEEAEERIAEIAALGQVTPELVRSRLVQSNRLEALSREITERNVFEFLSSRSKIRTEE